MVTVVEFLQLAVEFLQPVFTALSKRLSLGQEGRVTPFGSCYTMVVVKALYGIPGSGKQWAERFAAILRQEGWVPCHADHDVWMNRNGDVYEYLGTYVDDLIIAAKNPNELLDVLVNKYKLQLKGTEKLQYHLGADYSCDG